MVSGLLVERRVLRHRLEFCVRSAADTRLRVTESHTFSRCPETYDVQSIVDWLAWHYFTTKYE